jgi:hypothetical protein
MAPPTYFGNLPPIQSPQSDQNFLQMAQQAEALNTAKQLSPYQVAGAAAGVQGQQLQIQQQQLEIQSQEGLMKAYLAANGDPDKATQIAPQYGVLPKDIMAFRTNMMNLAKTKSEVDKNVQDVTDEWHDTLHNAYQPVVDEPDPAKQAQMVATINQGLLQRYPNKQASDLVQWTDPNAFKMAMAAYTTDKWTTAQGALMRGAAAGTNAGTNVTKENAELPAQQAASELALRSSTAGQLGAATAPDAYDQIRDSYIAKGGNQAIFPPSRMVYDQTGAMVPAQRMAIQRAGMTAEQRTQADQAAAVAAQNAKPKTEAELAATANDPTKSQAERDQATAALKTLDASKIAARPVVNVNTTAPGLPANPNQQQQQLSGEAFLGSLPPGTAAQIRAIAEGRAVMPSAATRSQAAIQIRNAVFQYDPTYSDQRAQVRKAFTTGSDGRNIGALNTAAVHLDQFADAATAMQNGSFTPGNAVWNSLRSTFGSTAPTNFQTLKTAVSGEMASALKGNATDPEIANVSKAIDEANSPAQLQGVVETNLHVLGAKLSTYQQRYQQQIPGDQVWSPVLPAAKGVFSKHGFDPTAPAGQAPPANPAATTYKQTATGPNGHKIGSNDGGRTWFDAQTGTRIQ